MEMFLLALAGSALSIAVTWGIFTNRLDTLQKENQAMKDEMKTFVTKETCVQSHKYTDRDMNELKQSIREIKEMIQRLIEKE